MMQSRMVMIVDDNLIDQMITAHVLKNTYLSKDIIVMENATLALNYLEANKHNPEALPSLILLDIDMPEMTGFDFLKGFRKFTNSLKEVCKIVVITGSDVPGDIALMKADPYVTKLILKPLNRNELISMI